jgi:hypothetical protein
VIDQEEFGAELNQAQAQVRIRDADKRVACHDLVQFCRLV